MNEYLHYAVLIGTVIFAIVHFGLCYLDYIQQGGTGGNHT